MLISRTRTFQVLFLLTSLTFMLSACSSNKGSGEDGDFVLNVYHGASEVGGDSVAFNELIAREDRPIFLNFWAGNCPPCRAEMPALQAAWEQYDDQVLFVGVDIGPYVGLGNTKQAKALIEELGVTYPTGNTANRGIVRDWQIKSMPSTFLINPDGRVHDIVIGAISSSRISQKVRELIAANAG